MEESIIFHEQSEIVYVGQSKNLRKRMKQHLSSDASIKKSTFRRTLVRKIDDVHPENTLEWIIGNYKISFEEIEDHDMRKLVESLLILYLRKQGNNLLNN